MMAPGFQRAGRSATCKFAVGFVPLIRNGAVAHFGQPSLTRDRRRFSDYDEMKQAIESRQEAYDRITDGIRNHSDSILKLVSEAKRLEIWKEKWSSWTEYCEKEFGKSRQRVAQLLDVSVTIEELQTSNMFDASSGKNKAILQNLNSRQAAALKGLPTVQKAEVLAKAIAAEGGKSPKPATIATARRSSFDADAIPRNNDAAYLSGPTKPEKNGKPDIQLDKVGRPIPENILELWNRAYEIGTRLRSAVSAIKCELEQSIDKDMAFAELVNSVVSDAKSLHYSLAHILPYAVCPTCNGKLPEKCTTCRHRGFISQFYWEGPTVGNDLRTMIVKQAKSYANSQTLSA